jgi:hypothetical protein
MLTTVYCSHGLVYFWGETEYEDRIDLRWNRPNLLVEWAELLYSGVTSFKSSQKDDLF